jgi:hypothetical protein
MAEASGWQCLDQETLPPLERLLPDDVCQALHRDMHHALDDMIALAPPPSRALTLVKRLQKHRDSLLSFLQVPGAEFHNNRAERQLRPVVIFGRHYASLQHRSSKGCEEN